MALWLRTHPQVHLTDISHRAFIGSSAARRLLDERHDFPDSRCHATPILLPPLVLHHFLWSWLLGIDQSHPINWVLALMFAMLIATVVDSSILGLGFGQRV